MVWKTEIQFWSFLSWKRSSDFRSFLSESELSRWSQQCECCLKVKMSGQLNAETAQFGQPSYSGVRNHDLSFLAKNVLNKKRRKNTFPLNNERWVILLFTCKEKYQLHFHREKWSPDVTIERSSNFSRQSSGNYI